MSKHNDDGGDDDDDDNRWKQTYKFNKRRSESEYQFLVYCLFYREIRNKYSGFIS